jgi:hypothetical protein
MHTTKTIVNDFFAFFRGGLGKSCFFAQALQLSLVPIAVHALSESISRFFKLPSKSGSAPQARRQISFPFRSLGVKQGSGERGNGMRKQINPQSGTRLCRLSPDKWAGDAARARAAPGIERPVAEADGIRRRPVRLLVLQFPKHFFDGIRIQNRDRAVAVGARHILLQIDRRAAAGTAYLDDLGFQAAELDWRKAANELFFTQKLEKRCQPSMSLRTAVVAEVDAAFQIVHQQQCFGADRAAAFRRKEPPPVVAMLMDLPEQLNDGTRRQRAALQRLEPYGIAGIANVGLDLAHDFSLESFLVHGAAAAGTLHWRAAWLLRGMSVIETRRSLNSCESPDSSPGTPSAPGRRDHLPSW